MALARLTVYDTLNSLQIRSFNAFRLLPSSDRDEQILIKSHVTRICDNTLIDCQIEQ